MLEQTTNNHSTEYIKNRTLELYDLLPQTEERASSKYFPIRDEVFMLNYKFFGYIASHKYINNGYISYEDKFQSACRSFLDIWWKYKYAPKYRTDLSFGVFFKPRITEMMDREFDEVKYSIRRTLCMEAGEQLNKHWAKVRYEDLNKVNLPAEKMASLKAIFGCLYWAELDTHAVYLNADEYVSSIEDQVADLDDKYDSIEELLVVEMVEQEKKLTNKDLNNLSKLLSLDVDELKRKLPKAERILFNRLHQNMIINEQFEKEY